MHIAIDARPLSKPMTGVARYLCNIVRNLEVIDTHNEYFLYSNRDFEMSICNKSNWHKRIGSGMLARIGTCWLQTLLTKSVRKDRIDVFWGTAHVLPLSLPAHVPTVLTMHDLVYHFYPETLNTFNLMVNRLFVRRSAQKADAIIAVSQSTAHDLVERLGVEREKIHVIPEGVDTNFFSPLFRKGASDFLSERYGIEGKYILSVGTIEPRKNIPRLLEAYDILRAENSPDFQLVIVGAKGWKNKAIVKQLEEAHDPKGVKFLKYVSDQDLVLLYSAADLFAFPSIYEGFGLPLLEAMACGTPVVASNVSSIPEVVGEAGVLFNPNDAGDIRRAITTVVGNGELQKQLREKGLQRVKAFSWEDVSIQTLRILEGIVERKGGSA